MTPPLIEMRGISKSFGGVRANEDVELVLRRRRDPWLLGENGAGKTTLIHLFGVYQADHGTIAVEGGRSPSARLPMHSTPGIGMVHPHFHLAPALSVLDNLLSACPQVSRLDRGPRACRPETHRAAIRPGARSDRRSRRCRSASSSGLEIVRRCSRRAHPHPRRADRGADAGRDRGLFVALRAMASRVSASFISHKLNEVRALTHRCVVLRHGRVAAMSRTPARPLPQRWRGDVRPEIVPPVRPASTKGDVVLSLDGVSTAGHAGTPLRAPASPCAAATSSASPASPATARRAGRHRCRHAGAQRGQHHGARQPCHDFTPNAMMRSASAHPEDRMTEGLVTALPLAAALCCRASATLVQPQGLLKPAHILDFAREQIRAYDIRCPGRCAGGSLSAATCRSTAGPRARLRPAVLIAAQTDARPRHRRHRLRPREILGLRAKGCGLVVISEDLDELLTLSDRIAVDVRGHTSRACSMRARPPSSASAC